MRYRWCNINRDGWLLAQKIVDTVIYRIWMADTAGKLEYAKFVKLPFEYRHIIRQHSFVYRSCCLSSVPRNGIIIARIQFRDPAETMDH